MANEWLMPMIQIVFVIIYTGYYYVFSLYFYVASNYRRFTKRIPLNQFWSTVPLILG